MDELIGTELDDVGVAAEMLRMTGVALECRRAIQPAMKAVLRGEIRGDIFVASETELRLARTIAPVVARRALLFVLRVRSAQLARHQKCFGIHGISPLSSEQADEHCENPYGVTEPLPHVLADAASVHVDGDDVHDGRDHQHEDQRQMQRMPQRKQSLVSLELRDPAGRDQSLVDICGGGPAQALAL